VVEPSWSVRPDRGVDLKAKVTLMCGCPIEPGGDWNAADYRVKATLRAGRLEVGQADLAYAGQPSTFGASLTPVPPGRYVLQVTAINLRSFNTTVSERAITVR
jgi:hypothetical protein